MKIPKLGNIIVTAAANTALAKAGQKPDLFLSRHVYDLVRTGDSKRLVSIHALRDGVQIKIQTKQDSSQTTVSLPEEPKGK